ncbi:MAG TPA: S-layer homology domain-containing protein [Mycobacteriales bacterium]|nr:S-layer homology domain-containing protein [Mycobacteriales bacterium]
MRRSTARLLAAALAPALVPVLSVGASAAPERAPQPAAAAGAAVDAADVGSDRGPDVLDAGTMRDPSAPPAELFATPLSDSQAEARAASAGACPLSFYPVDENDQSLVIGVTPYHDIAPRLCAADRSTRVSLAVAGRSVQGRELPLATVTAPETAEQAQRNDELTRLMVDDPARAKQLLETGGYAGYKPTLLANANIHGNEWEGTDYSLSMIEYLATAPASAPVVQATDGMSAEQRAALPTVGDVLSRFRLVFLVTANPDGRVLGRRQNDRFIDMNRDHITQSQPETVAMRDVILKTQPLLFQDHHGYVAPGSFYTGYGLIEPGTPPHGESYEYDLYIRNALPLAVAAEADIARRRDAGRIPQMLVPSVPPARTTTTIPFRDLAEGWDDWPPIFTPMYAMLHGSVGATIEFPFNPRGAVVPDRATRVASNIEYGRATMDTKVVFGAQNRDRLLADQVETFLRAASGAPSAYLPERTPDGFVPGWGADDRYPTEFPRAYLIARGAGQASDAAAARLVRHLVANDAKVRVLESPVTVDGTTYAAGSWAVDMHQAKRAVAHTMLHDGTDISSRVDAMYDISGWSLARLWGATVASTQDGSFLGASKPVTAVAPVGGVEEGDALGYSLRLTTPEEITAVNRLLDAGTALQRTPDGTVLVPASARPQLVALAAELDVPVRRVTELPAQRAALRRLKVASALGTVGSSILGTSSYRLLDDVLGYEVTPVTPAQISGGTVDLSLFDVLVTAEGQLTWSNLGTEGQRRLREFLASGKGLVTYGRASALNLVGPSGLVPGLTVAASRTDANGVLSLTGTDNAVLPGRTGPASSFGYPIAWFPEVGAATPLQVLAADPLLSGHWRPGSSTTTQAAQEAAGGKVLTLAATVEGSGRLVSFGSEPLYRWHTRGLFDELADALLWAAGTPATTADLGAPYTAPRDPDPQPDPGTPARTPQDTAAPRDVDDSCPPGRVPALRFPDVPAGDVHQRTIRCVDWWQVARGFDDGTYRPLGTVTRGQMASFVARTVVAGGGTLPSQPGDAFSDDDGTTHELAVNQLAAVGIVLGREDRTYGPDQPVTRAQMASFLVRAYRYVAGVDLPRGGPYFLDTVGVTQREDIDRAAAVGLTGGREDGRYEPFDPTLRGQMATFLSRLLDLFVEDGSAELPTR